MNKRQFLKTSGAIVTGSLISRFAPAQKQVAKPLTNWAGNLTYSTTSLREPAGIGEIQSLVKKSPRVKVLGTRHSFNTIADSKDQLISTARLCKVLSLDETGLTVTAGSGVRYGELAVWLHQRGYALHNLASLPHISIAGGCATATHGSGVLNGNLSSAVRAMEFVDAAGELRTLARDKDPQEFPGAVVHLGGIGVVTRLTLAIQPTYQVRQRVYEGLPLSGLEHYFDEIMSAGYSVSLFTNWQNNTINEIWIKSRVGEERDGQFTSGLLGARAAVHPLHPISGVSPEHCTEQMGVPGAWHDRLPHFRMEFTPSNGSELQSEYFIPRDRSVEAIMAVEALRDEISPLLLISEIRCIAEDDLWMSPCYHQASTAIHFTWRQDASAVSRLLPLIEERLAPFHARPHWGKLFATAPQRIAVLYERSGDFRQLLQRYDPDGKFRNPYLDTLIFGS